MLNNTILYELGVIKIKATVMSNAGDDSLDESIEVILKELEMSMPDVRSNETYLYGMRSEVQGIINSVMVAGVEEFNKILKI